MRHSTRITKELSTPRVIKVRMKYGNLIEYINESDHLLAHEPNNAPISDLSVELDNIKKIELDGPITKSRHRSLRVQLRYYQKRLTHI